MINLDQEVVRETPSEPWIDRNEKHHGENICEKNIKAGEWHKYFGTTRITPDIKRLYFDCGQNTNQFINEQIPELL